MSTQYVAPVRYQDDEVIAPVPVKRDVGFRRWLFAGGLIALSWWMYGLGAIAYSTLSFLVGMFLFFAFTVHLWLTKPKKQMAEVTAEQEHQRRMKLLEKWGK